MTNDERKERVLRMLEKVPAGKLDRLLWFIEGLVVGRY